LPLAALTFEAMMNIPKVDISVPEARFEIFFPLLRQGVRVLVREGQTVKGFLRDELGLNPDTIASRVQTVFLNGHPVDDMAGTWLEEGAVLSLSAAMPGLLGACMRVDSPYATMRDSITQGRSAPAAVQEGASTLGFTLKLFNFMAREIGPCVLQRGVVVDSERVLALLGDAGEEGLWEGGAGLAIDGALIDPLQEPLAARVASRERLLVRVAIQ
jgi:hypothetical protein